MRIVFEIAGLGLLGLVAMQEVSLPYTMSPEFLAVLGGWVLSWALDNLPKFNKWFGGLDDNGKRWAVRGLLGLTALLLTVGACLPGVAGLFEKYITLACSQEGLLGLVEAYFFAAIASQARFLLAARPKQGKMK